MIDLHALSTYHHHLNAHASDEAIAAFHAKGFYDQVAIAMAWARGEDTKADRQLAEDNA